MIQILTFRYTVFLWNIVLRARVHLTCTYFGYREILKYINIQRADCILMCRIYNLDVCSSNVPTRSALKSVYQPFWNHLLTAQSCGSQTYKLDQYYCTTLAVSLSLLTFDGYKIATKKNLLCTQSSAWVAMNTRSLYYSCVFLNFYSGCS